MKKWNTLPSKKVVQDTVTALEANGFIVYVVVDKAAALEKVTSLIPKGGEVMVGSSTTLNEIGFTKELESGEKWENVQAKVWSENDDVKRSKLRRQALASDYFVASANAITVGGAVVAVDATGSRVSAFPFSAGKLLLVVGVNKIVSDVPSAMERIREYVFPLENKRAQAAYGVGSTPAKWVILEKETQPERTTIILVEEQLGF